MTYFLIFLASILVGFINTLAGSGSLIMLPILMYIVGLPASVANGTNRVAVLVQSFIGVSSFIQSKKISFRGAAWSVVPAIIGAILGAWLATKVADNALENIIGWLMLFMLGVILINPKRWLSKEQQAELRYKTWQNIVIMFVIGFYGGFIQAGVGAFLLAGLVLQAGYLIGQANAIKLVIVLAFATPVLLIFAISGQVDWFWGFFTAAGQGIGAFLGARFATRYKNANVWIYRLLIIVVIAAIIKFFDLWNLILHFFTL